MFSVKWKIDVCIYLCAGLIYIGAYSVNFLYTFSLYMWHDLFLLQWEGGLKLEGGREGNLNVVLRHANSFCRSMMVFGWIVSRIWFYSSKMVNFLLLLLLFSFWVVCALVVSLNGFFVRAYRKIYFKTV